MSTTEEGNQSERRIQEIDSATVRFAGDSGDGMQLVGGQFTTASVFSGNDISTLPDYPAEIRAPAGVLAGVSGFQINFSSHKIHTPGDVIDALFAMNPAALKVNLADLKRGGLLIVNSESFSQDDLEKADYSDNPLEDGSLEDYRIVSIPITSMNRGAVEGLGLDRKAADRCKNFFVLGLAYWIYNRPLDNTLAWIDRKFTKNPALRDANRRTLEAGFHFGETAELFDSSYQVRKAPIAPGTYAKITGNEAVVYGLLAASHLSNKPLFYGSYPITPASDILHQLAGLKQFGVVTFQAEDEIAAVCSAIGAAFGGSLAATGTSGPGVSLKSEAIGLAVMTELPLVIVNVQRGGPSTGLPTKTEQADLFQALFGRHGECPLPVLAASTPADCFTMTIEAARIAMEFMTPVILLTDGYIANGSEPWKIPDLNSLPKINVEYYVDIERFQPYARNERLSRPWAIPGTPDLMHRIGGLEKQHITGAVSYDGENHEYMVKLRQAKIDGVEEDIPNAEIFGDPSGKLLVLSWGGVYGAAQTAVEFVRESGKSVSSVHLKYLNPFPKNLKKILPNFKKILIPELNLGQLRYIIRAHFLIDAIGLNKTQGKPFRVDEIVEAIDRALEAE
ncbi:MAG: 2-oxoacid:acceptor oxidoreductase subunit alpha [Candidatus Omnitrophota bacterium]